MSAHKNRREIQLSKEIPGYLLYNPMHRFERIRMKEVEFVDAQKLHLESLSDEIWDGFFSLNVSHTGRRESIWREGLFSCMTFTTNDRRISTSNSDLFLWGTTEGWGKEEEKRKNTTWPEE